MKRRNSWRGGTKRLSVLKWFEIAKNEYRVRTSSIRNIRLYFPFLVTGLLAVYLMFIAPTLVNLFLDDFLAFILSQVALAVVEIILFMIFIYLVILPITNTLQGMKAGQVEIFLAAPVRPKDVLLGEFLGTMPFYAIAVTLITGFFTAALNPLGLSMVQIAIIVLVFVIISLSALWIGTVTSAIVRTKFARSSRGKDVGRALSLIIVIPLVAVFYAIISGGLLEALSDPGTNSMLRVFLSLLPSSWGGDIIMGFANNPGNIVAVGFETLTRFGGLVAFFAAALLLGTKAAARAYSLEPVTFIAARAKPNGFFYKTVKLLGGGGSFGTLIVSIFKDYSRRLENFSRIAYVVGLIIMVNFFFGSPEDIEDALVMTQFLLSFLAIFSVGQVTLGGKETLFIHRKSPSGLSNLVKARLLQGLLLVTPIAAVITIVSIALVPGITIVPLLFYTMLVVLLVASNATFALGLALLNPVFSENTRSQMGGLIINGNIVMFTSVGIFFGSMIILNLGFINTLLLQTGLIGSFGIVSLYLGKKKLSRIE